VNDVNVLLEMVKKKVSFSTVSHIGHLGGAVNAVALAKSSNVDSVVLLSPLDPYEKQAAFTGARIFQEIQLKDLKSKVLVVAHEDTDCKIVDYSNSERLARGVAFVTVKGYSAIDQASRTACAYLGKHGFIGREREVGFATLNFIEGIGSPPKEIR
jgi:hypothetical protein